MKTLKKHLSFLPFLFFPFLVVSAQEKVLPEDLIDVGEFGGWDAEGIMTHSMVEYNGYLYATNNDDLWIYDIASNPEAPNHITTISLAPYYGNKLFIQGNNLFITAGTSGQPTFFLIYSLDDPTNPQIQSFTDTGPFPILDIVFNDQYAFIINVSSEDIAIYDVSNISLPQLHSNFPLGGEGKTLAINSGRNILFAGFYGSASNQKLGMFSITDINNITVLDEKSTFGDIPQKIKIIDENSLWFIKNFTGNDGSLLYAYDYSDGQNLNSIDSILIGIESNSWDLEIVSDFLTVSLPNFGLATYELSDGNEIIAGPTIELIEPRDFVVYNSVKKYEGSIYSYVINGYGMGAFVDGSYPNKIIKALPPGGGNNVFLFMNINPAEAAANGCNTIPAPGQHDYNLNDNVNLTATPNEEGGWYFKEWTGDVSGTAPNETIIMDADKNVTANFVNVELTVSGDNFRMTYCPNYIEEENEIFILDISVCASEEDGWNLQKLDIRSSGTGNEMEDIEEVIITLGGEIIYSGAYNSDDGMISLSFNPTVPIGAGECAYLEVTYKFQFDTETYANNEIKTFYAETSGTVAEPWNYDNGKISGSAKSEYLTFARVSNSRGYGFTYIDEAINSSETLEGDDCIVCPGTYVENIEIHNKNSLYIYSSGTREDTKILPAPGRGFALNINRSYNITFDGFTFEGGQQNTLSAILLYYSDDCYILNNSFREFSTGIRTGNNSGLLLSTNSFENCKTSFFMFGAEDCEIYDNDINYHNSDYSSSSFEIINSTYNIFNNNKSNYGMSFELTSSNFNTISNNIVERTNAPKVIQLKGCRYNDILNNNLDIIIDEYKFEPSSNNVIKENNLKSIVIKNSYDNYIANNKIKYGQIGINIIGKRNINGELINSYENKIIDNLICNNFDYGIKIIDSYADKITNNLIMSNGDKENSGKSGIYLEGVEYTKIKKNRITLNNESGISAYFSDNLSIVENKIDVHNKLFVGYGVRLFFVNNSYILGNLLNKNCTGISLISSKDNKIESNYIRNSMCTNTGIHLDSSDVEIVGNSIIDNNGNGIFCENNSIPFILNNNIMGNSEFGLNNSDQQVTVIANENYWGDESGPGEYDITGNVDASNWLSEEVALVVLAEKDTIYSSPEKTDSTLILIQNISDPVGRVKLTVNDDKNWIEPINEVELDFQDSTGVESIVYFTVPANALSNEIATVTYTVEQIGKSTNIITGKFYISTYLPTITRMFISPDSLTIAFGDTVQLSVLGFDQFNNLIDVDPQWSAENGSISNDGLFVSDNTNGEILITVTDQNSGEQATSVIYNTNEEQILTQISIDPATVNLAQFQSSKFFVQAYNQFNYPYFFDEVWEADGGVIIDGFYVADSIPGIFTVSVTDSIGLIVANATVEIEYVVSVDEEENIIPNDFALKQNYPNPFNPSTTIEYQLPVRSKVRIEIFNILGQRIAFLANKFENAGHKSLTWNANNKASGVYIVRLIAEPLSRYGNSKKDKFISHKKMILLK